MITRSPSWLSISALTLRLTASVTVFSRRAARTLGAVGLAAVAGIEHHRAHADRASAGQRAPSTSRPGSALAGGGPRRGGRGRCARSGSRRRRRPWRRRAWRGQRQALGARRQQIDHQARRTGVHRLGRARDRSRSAARSPAPAPPACRPAESPAGSPAAAPSGTAASSASAEKVTASCPAPAETVASVAGVISNTSCAELLPNSPRTSTRGTRRSPRTSRRPARRYSIRCSSSSASARVTNSGVTNIRPSWRSGGAASDTSRPCTDTTVRSGASTAVRWPAVMVAAPVARSSRTERPNPRNDLVEREVLAVVDGGDRQRPPALRRQQGQRRRRSGLGGARRQAQRQRGQQASDRAAHDSTFYRGHASRPGGPA